MSNWSVGSKARHWVIGLVIMAVLGLIAGVATAVAYGRIAFLYFNQ